ncbi:hypothetical protein QFZ76_009524 [Streptomyces sp. V4I2]|nr:hypothetical protein [Streptomyces sp. V4I2]
MDALLGELRTRSRSSSRRRAGSSRRLSAWRINSGIWTKVTEGAGSAAAARAMVLKLVESAQACWRSVNAPHLVALVGGGVRIERGHLVEPSETLAA